jgi:hypothetical protein
MRFPSQKSERTIRTPGVSSFRTSSSVISVGPIRFALNVFLHVCRIVSVVNFSLATQSECWAVRLSSYIAPRVLFAQDLALVRYCNDFAKMGFRHLGDEDSLVPEVGSIGVGG